MYIGVIDHAESNGNVHFLITCFSGAARLLAQLLQELSHNLNFFFFKYILLAFLGVPKPKYEIKIFSPFFIYYRGVGGPKNTSTS